LLSLFSGLGSSLFPGLGYSLFSGLGSSFPIVALAGLF